MAALEQEGIIAQRGQRRVRTLRLPSDRPSDNAILARTIVLVSEFELRPSEFHLSSGWDASILLAAVESFHAAGYSALLTHPKRFAEASAESIASVRPAGVMLTYGPGASSHGQALLAACRNIGVPAVVYGDAPELADHDRVRSDHARGAYELTRWLISQGRRRILPFWRMSQTPGWLAAREAGYRAAMADAGLEPLPAVRTPDLTDFFWSQSQTEADFLSAVRVLLGFLIDSVGGPDPVDAIMTATDPHAVQVMAALRLLGKQPGRELPVVGYDNTYRDIAEYQWQKTPPAATVDRNVQAIARQMTALLLDRINGSAPPQPRQCDIQPTLIIPRE